LLEPGEEEEVEKPKKKRKRSLVEETSLIKEVKIETGKRSSLHSDGGH